MTVGKTDKSNTLIILKTSDYFEKLDVVVRDSNKFLKVEHDPTEALKKKLNGFIESIKLSTSECNIPKLIGLFVWKP